MINRTLYLFLLSLSFLVAQINGKSIAILDFEGIGVNSIESSSLTGIFHSEVTKTNTVTLVDRKTINRIENGHFSPALDTIVRLSVALGITPSALLAK